MHPGQVPPAGYQPAAHDPNQAAYPAVSKVPPGYPQGTHPSGYQQNGQNSVPPGYTQGAHPTGYQQNGQSNAPQGYQYPPSVTANGQASAPQGYTNNQASVPQGYANNQASVPQGYTNNQPTAVPGYSPNPPSAAPGYSPSQPTAAPGYSPSQPTAAPGYTPNQPNVPPGYAPNQSNVPPGFPPNPPAVPQGYSANQPAAPPGVPSYPTRGVPQQNFPQAAPSGFAQPGYGPPQAGMPPGFPPAVPGSSGDPYGQAPRRLDLSALPSAVQVFEDDRNTRSGPFPTGYASAEHPPLSNTEFDAQDQGNSNPKFIRSSLYCVPQTSDILKQTGIPFALSLNPFAQLSENEHPVPVIDLGELGPVRCQRCKAYISPFMEFIDGGRKFRCAFCHTGSAGLFCTRVSVCKPLCSR